MDCILVLLDFFNMIDSILNQSINPVIGDD